ncbi:AMP-binding protein, partial [Actinomycetota bacterium]
VALLREAYGSHVLMVNGLGLTECGLVCQFFIRPGDHVSPGPLPVGSAVPDVEISIAHPSGAEAPVGEEGEVVVRSPYLAEGYWNDPERTAASFIRSADGERRYHTGDVGRLAPDGRLYLVGRIDDQVKVRGATLNLGTVEAIILAQPGVTGAVVVLEEGHDSVGLVAEVTCEPGAALDRRQIRSAILERLPTAAIPIIRQVEALPTTAAGKLDRRRNR